MSTAHQPHPPGAGRLPRRLRWQYFSDGPGEVLVGTFGSSPARSPSPPVEDPEEARDEALRFEPSVWGLFVPADVTVPCRVGRVPRTTTGISESIGGPLAETPCLVEPGVHTIYQDADRDVRGLASNPRAFRLAARLSWPHVERRISLRGTVLVLGLDGRGQDTHVPALVLEAAIREQMLPGGRAMLVLNGTPSVAGQGERRVPRVPEENAC